MPAFSMIGDFATPSYLLFALVCIVGTFSAPRPWRGWLILAASTIALVNMLSVWGLIVYAALLPLVFGLGLASQPKRRLRHFSFYSGVTLLLAGFVVLRLATGYLASAETASEPYVAPMPIVLGYSYFLFRALNFLIASSTGSIERPRPLPYANLMLFFPSFTAGPITRYGDYADVLTGPERPDGRMMMDAAQRVLNGLIKMTVIVPTLAQFSLLSFGSPDEIAGVGVGWIATIAFYLYLYLNFSAYSDIAIGIGLALGCRLPENFNYPFLRTNLLRFWESWHMSLTSWIRDHVFIPLTWKLTATASAGAFERKQINARTIGYLTTMTLFGIWHGFTVEFAVFGLIQGVGLALTRAFVDARKRRFTEAVNARIDSSLLTRIGSAIVVNLFIALSLILFRYDVSDAYSLVIFLFTGVR
jgi:alginate O-acetyltransferase complex protein AlgI